MSKKREKNKQLFRHPHLLSAVPRQIRLQMICLGYFFSVISSIWPFWITFFFMLNQPTEKSLAYFYWYGFFWFFFLYIFYVCCINFNLIFCVFSLAFSRSFRHIFGLGSFRKVSFSNLNIQQCPPFFVFVFVFIENLHVILLIFLFFSLRFWIFCVFFLAWKYSVVVRRKTKLQRKQSKTRQPEMITTAAVVVVVVVGGGGSGILITNIIWWIIETRVLVALFPAFCCLIREFILKHKLTK